VFNKKDDLCTSPIHEKKSMNNTILLVHRCECDPIKQVEHAQQMGANAVIFYTDTTNSTTDVDVLSTAVLPIVFINNANGYRIFSALSHKPQAQFTNALVAMNAPESDILHTVSGFSSQGPTNELQLKPEIVGVGGNVFSTLPNYLKSYGFRSGTSMAAPFVSGQIALLLEKKRLKPDEVKGLLMNFATQGKRPHTRHTTFFFFTNLYL
jgi:subtilisin family serine protease